MKAFWISLAVLVAIIQPLRALQLADAGSRPVTVEVDSISLSDIASDSVTLSVRSHVTSLRKLRIKRIRFEQMRMGTLPVYLDPIEEKLSLEANTPVDLPAIPVKIYFRDLDSLGPIQHAVSDGQATIDGNARVDLDLNLLERFATNEWNAHADMPISLSVPVDVPGGMLGRAAALVTLGGAQVALDVGGRILNPLRQSLAGEDELRRRYAPSLVVAESRYTLIRNQQRVTVAVRQLGFRISADQFVLTGEMLEPWTYDTDVAVALKTGNASLADTDRELLVWPVGTPMDANSSRSLSTGGIQVLHAPRETESTEVPTADGHVKVRISRRDSNSNYAVLRFTRPEDQGTPVALGADSKAHPRDWNQLAMFRVSDEGRLDVVVTPADRDGDRIHLQNPLDNSAFGSVLISEDGVAGMLQDERSGMTLRNKW